MGFLAEFSMTELKKERIIEQLVDQERNLKILADKLSDVARLIYTSEDGSKIAQNMAIEALRIGEKQFLKLKESAAVIMDMTGNSPYEIYGTTADFPAEISKIGDDKWKIHLPIFSPISASRKNSGDGRYMYYLVFNLLNEYQKKYKNTDAELRILEEPLVIYRYHILPERNLVFDFDNVDSKSSLDAMQGFFFTDDNAFSLTTIQNAVRSKESYTDIYVMEKPKKFLAQKR